MGIEWNPNKWSVNGNSIESVIIDPIVGAWQDGWDSVTGQKAADAMIARAKTTEEKALLLQDKRWNIARNDAAPFRDAGETALSKLTSKMGNYENFGYGGYQTSMAGVAGAAGPDQFGYAGQQPGEFSYDGQQDKFSYDGRQQMFGYGGQQPDAFLAGDAFRSAQAEGPFQGRDRFNFNLQADEGYNFAQAEAAKSIERAGASRGGRMSGGILAALSDRSAGIASTYANDAFNRQFMSSKENYGRNVSEYGMDVSRNNEMYARSRYDDSINYSRDLDSYGLDVEREQRGYSREVSQYGMEADREQSDYNRSVSAYDMDRSRESTEYNRSVGAYNMDRSRESAEYNRNMDSYNLGIRTNNTNYNREVSMYDRAVSREQTSYARAGQESANRYGRNQDYLSRLASIAGLGQTTSNQQGQLGAGYAQMGTNTYFNSMQSQNDADYMVAGNKAALTSELIGAGGSAMGAA